MRAAHGGPEMHVFIDTNILLNFFHYSKDELDALNDVFGSHEQGAATVYLTEQVRNEFVRNREAKIRDAIRKFESTRFAQQFPYFMKGYDEYSTIRARAAELEELRTAILAKVQTDVAAHNLVADKLIHQIFETSPIVPVTKEIYEGACMRMALGNPPGKDKSMGDSVNWLILMASVPNEHDVHVISDDGDFYSSLDENRAHPFLTDEWQRGKKGTLHVYRTLSAFMGRHFDGVAFSFDKDKEALIDALREAGAFAVTHDIISRLEDYGYFSLKEVKRILDAAIENTQLGWIITDYDVSDFLNRVAVPRMAEIDSDEHREILQKVIEEQVERKKLA